MIDNELVPFEVKYQIEKYKERVEEVVTYVKSLEIESKDDAKKALDIACDAINLHERIEDTRKEIIQPSATFASEINKLAKDFTKDLENVKEVVANKVDGWKEEAGEEGSIETDKVLAIELTDYQFDVKDLMMVPPEYLTIDEARIKLAMKKGVRVIPGLELRKSKKLSIRRK